MKRRAFLALATGAAAIWPTALRAQQNRIWRVAVLTNYTESDSDTRVWIEAFGKRLKELGWNEGTNLRLEYRWAAGNVDRLRTYANEVAKLKPDVILAASTPTVAALQKATETLPVVFSNVADPVANGFVKSMARPGGNITGFTSFAPGMGEKWVEMLKEMAPAVERIAMIANPQTQSGQFVRSVEAASVKLGIPTVRLAYRDERSFEQAFERFAVAPNGGILVLPDSTNVLHRDLIVRLAARHRVPAVYPLRIYVDRGGLAYYGNDRTDQWRQAADYVDRILKGALPAELPIQAPIKFELVINLKTAKAFGLTVPPTLLARADEVIE